MHVEVDRSMIVVGWIRAHPRMARGLRRLLGIGSVGLSCLPMQTSLVNSWAHSCGGPSTGGTRPCAPPRTSPFFCGSCHAPGVMGDFVP